MQPEGLPDRAAARWPHRPAVAPPDPFNYPLRLDAGLLLNLISTITLVLGAIFGVAQLRFYGARRQREAMLTLVASFQTPEFVHAMRVALDPAIPDGLSRSELEARVGAEIDGVWLLLSTWESLGVMVCRRQVDLDLIDDFFSGVIGLSWLKFGRYVADIRGELRRDTYFEWFQWLAERLAERETQAPPIPGHLAERGWRR